MIWKVVLLVWVATALHPAAAAPQQAEGEADCSQHEELYQQIDIDLQVMQASPARLGTPSAPQLRGYRTHHFVQLFKDGITSANAAATLEHCKAHAPWHVCIQARALRLSPAIP